MQEQLNPASSPYRVEMEKVVASWEDVAAPIEMQLHHVAIYNKENNAKLVELEQVAFSFSFPKLFVLQVMPETVILRKPSLRVFQDEQHRFHLGIGEEKLPLSFNEITPRKDGGSLLLSGLRYIAVQDATLHWGEEGEASSFAFQRFYMRLKHANSKVFATFEGELNHASGDVANVKGSAEYNAPALKVAVEFDGVNPKWFASLWQEKYPQIAMDVSLKGKADARFQGTLPEQVQFQVSAPEGGTVEDSTHFAEPLHFTALSISGGVEGKAEKVVIDQLSAAFGGAKLNASGHFAKEGEDFTALVNANASGMPVNDLYKYWPKTIAPTAYEWVTTHIREGVGSATLRFEKRKEDIGKPLPKEALQVEIHGEGVEVHYLEGHPKAVDVAGEVLFDTQSMTIRSEKGRMLQDSHLKRAYLQIPDLMALHAPMHIQIEADALAADVAEYLSSPVLNYAAPLGLDKNTISGRMQGNMVFDFHLPDTHSNVPYDADLHFMIAAQLQQLAQPAFMGNKNVTDATGKVVITEQEVNYNGLLQIEDSPLTIDLTHSFAKDNALPTHYTAKGKLNVDLLPVFGVPALPFLNGVADIQAEVREGLTQNTFKAEADIGAVSIWWPEWGVQKNLGQKGSFVVEGDVADKIDITRFAIVNEAVNLEGTGSFAKDFSRIYALDAPRIKLAGHDFSLHVKEKSPRYYQVTARGAVLNMASLKGGEGAAKAAGPHPKPEPEKSFAAGVDVDASFDRVIFAPEREITAFDVQGECPDMACESLTIAGTYGQKQYFGGEIIRKDGKRGLRFEAENAGSFLRAVNMYDSMQGGRLQIFGAFDDSKPSRPFIGRLKISEHTIVNAPSLAKLATLLSLSGIGDALAGKGISFKKLEMDITYEDGLIKIRDGKTIGPALGITMEDGVVDMENKAMRMKGTVIPSYTLNSVLGKIPLIGEALAGGKGEGIFAATYAMEGTYPDAIDVSVNPLSMLAPGFIRGIFGGVADTVAPQEKTPKEKELEQEAKEKVEEEHLPGETGVVTGQEPINAGDEQEQP